MHSKTTARGILLAIPLGCLAGFLLPQAITPVAPLGKLFIKALQMVALPLIFFSLSSAIVSVASAKKVGVLTLKAFAYYVLSMLAAVLTGFLLFQMINPGLGIFLESGAEIPNRVAQNKLGFWDFILKIIPDNPFAALAQGDFMAVIFLAIFFGIALSSIRHHQAQSLKDLLNTLNETALVMTKAVLFFAPIGVAILIGNVVANHLTGGQLKDLLHGLGKYGLVVFLGLVIQMFFTLPVMVKFLSKTSPYHLMKNVSSALLTAFSTASSNATLPVTLEALKSKAKLPQEIVSFTVPLGATCNMDGTALYECVVILFLAQAHGVILSFSEQIQVMLLSLVTAIGVAGIPMGSMVMMTLILKTLGLPAEWLALIIPLDRILDMCRTTVNVWDDCCGAAIIARWEGYRGKT